MTTPRRGRDAASFALLVALAAVSCARRTDETRFFNFDPESSGSALVSGWSDWEKTGAGDTFVWGVGREAHLRLQSRADGDRLVRVRCWPFRYPGAPPQTLKLSLNGEEIASTALSDEPRVYAFPAPRGRWRRGPNDLSLAFAYAEAPRDRVAGSGDARSLSAAFDWIEIVPVVK